MKKTLAFALCFVLLLFSISGCRQTKYELTSSEIDKLYDDASSEQTVVFPKSYEIIGYYLLNAADDDTSEPAWHARVSEKDGKLFLQVLKRSEKLVTPDSKTIENITSDYDESSGYFAQRYENEDYISAFDANFFIGDDGNINVSLKNNYIYAGNDEPSSRITAIGYKTEEER